MSRQLHTPVADANESHMEPVSAKSIPVFSPYSSNDPKDAFQFLDEKSCSVASFSTIGSHPGHHHLVVQMPSPGQNSFAWQHAEGMIIPHPSSY